jgi:hypothetical protein
MIPSEIEAIKAKVKDADIRRKQAAEQEKAEKERQRLEYETSPEYAHLTQAQNTEKWGSTLAAMNIRADLKKNFPGVKFSVKSERYSGGDSVNVYWTGGPDEKDVENVIDRYEAGSFDGMTDSYTYKKSVFTDVFGETKYLFCTRKEIA